VLREAEWFGRASQVSEAHVQWTFIDEVAEATRDSGRLPPEETHRVSGAALTTPRRDVSHGRDDLDARRIILERRSAVALDGVTALDRVSFERILSRILPGPGAPWDAMWWQPRIHLALFVHRVTDVEPGLYVLLRADEAFGPLKAACRSEFRWERVNESLPLWRLQAGDFRARSQRLSCDQAIASDGFFTLGMLADFAGGLAVEGPSFYRHLFWESGVVGQVLYLEAEAAGAGGTGIGCFYDDAVHATLGIHGHAFQSLYHFTVGMPVEDRRLTTEPGYPWQR
jgi:hypothetical protein